MSKKKPEHFLHEIQIFIHTKCTLLGHGKKDETAAQVRFFSRSNCLEVEAKMKPRNVHALKRVIYTFNIVWQKK